MPTNQRRTIHIQDLTPTGQQVWVRQCQAEGSAINGSVSYLYPARDLDRRHYGGRAVTQIDADKLLKRYQAERTATVEDCDQAIYSLSSAVDFFWEIMTRKGGPEMLRVRLRALSEIEDDLCRAITELSSKPVQEAAE